MSPVIRADLEGGVTRLSLSSGRGNPLTPAVLDALVQHLADLEAAPPRALVLDGGGAPIFSGGFALPIIASYDRDELTEFFANFNSALDLILRMPSPSICAVGGHAVAAGFILSLATDLRVVKRGSLKLGLPEVDLGVAVPAEAQVLFSARTNPQHSLRYCSTAELFDGDEGLRIGYADLLDDDPEARALALAAALAKKPGDGVAVGRTFSSLDLADRVKSEGERWADAFLDSWFSPPAQALLKAQAARLSGKR